eukprot:CAMPEP_0203842656 /NCGR_PEP_ID=MMETSP0359-20131031/2124_1 /ASSEMBLY_ACC=CAM_ASM_000338 /TAXON_ID=268821 /ORGANISM="Scrippsiella Hangoei, Strain SHTV-5" /LENGTH=56 /DNA_ID=CAMNT_0050757287 /DNA_START=140 /DNA_END=307 /DNA_ORIENTATION=+
MAKAQCSQQAEGIMLREPLYNVSNSHPKAGRCIWQVEPTVRTCRLFKPGVVVHSAS